MSEPAESPSGDTSSSVDSPIPEARPVDLERGLRGVMSAILILEAITILLGIRVVQQLSGIDGGLGTVAVVVVIVLAVGHIGACILVRRTVFVPIVAALQVILIGCWVFSAALGMTGIVFALVWFAVWYMRHEFRRRLAAGTIPGQAGQGAGQAGQEVRGRVEGDTSAERN